MNELEVRKWALEKSLDLEGEWKRAFPLAKILSDYVIHGTMPTFTQRGALSLRDKKE